MNAASTHKNMAFVSLCQATLEERLGVDNADTNGKMYDQIQVRPGILTKSVKITALSVYNAGNNGFNSIEIFASESESTFCSRLKMHAVSMFEN